MTTFDAPSPHRPSSPRMTIITKAVLLAAGKGTRMKQLTDDLPKPMLHVRGKPILLLFWAAWAPRSHATLAELGVLSASLDPDRAGLVTVNLDEDAAVAERALKGLGLDRWTHPRNKPLQGAKP